MVGQILRMIGQAFTDETLKEMIAEVDEDGKFSIQWDFLLLLWEPRHMKNTYRYIMFFSLS